MGHSPIIKTEMLFHKFKANLGVKNFVWYNYSSVCGNEKSTFDSFRDLPIIEIQM